MTLQGKKGETSALVTSRCKQQHLWQHIPAGQEPENHKREQLIHKQQKRCRKVVAAGQGGQDNIMPLKTQACHW